MEWSSGPTIGFNAAGDMFANHDPSSDAVACLNFPDTDWSNVIYRLSANTSELPPPCKSLVSMNMTIPMYMWSYNIIPL